MGAEQTKRAIAQQPEWLARVPTDRRFPDGARLLFTGCGTSFHAAQTGGDAVQALDLVLRPERDADVLVLVSHEGETPQTLEAARAWPGPKWLVTGKPDGPIAELCDEVVVATPEIEESWCHTASYTCAVAAIAALNGEDVSWLPDAVEVALMEVLPEVGEQERFIVAGAGRDWPTAQEAVLKLREGAWVAAEAHHTEQLLHGHLAAVDESVRAFVLEGDGHGIGRSLAAVAALRALGCDADLVPTRHPVVDVVMFQRLTVAVAEARGREPDRIRRHDERWADAAKAAKADNSAG
jgi:glutamine---fructose-6-phosphate transaminase (isomerizing)